MKLSEVISELVEERGLDKSTLSSVICEGMLAAYQKRYPEISLNVRHNKKTDKINVTVDKTVVSSVKDENSEISLRKARFINKNIIVGDVVTVPFEGFIGRIEILRAKQIIASKIREIEATAIYNEFIKKEGSIIHGVVHKCEHRGAVIKVQDIMAFLPKSLSLPGERCVVGFPIRALLKEVLAQPRGDSQLILDRTSPDFLRQLFELEIPEVFEKIVEVKKIVRSPGYKSKVLVSSHDSNIDPVGTCVGVGGVRIRPILKELTNEKIDVISWSDLPEIVIKNSLKPAVIRRVEMVDDKNANVWLDEDQRSFAIGKGGQNILLASRLTGVNIHLMRDETKALPAEDIFDEGPTGPKDEDSA